MRLRRLEVDLFAPDRLCPVLAFCRFRFSLIGLLAACFFAAFDFFGALLPAFTLRAVTRLVRFVIAPRFDRAPPWESNIKY